jgi:hypothetical protein
MWRQYCARSLVYAKRCGVERSSRGRDERSIGICRLKIKIPVDQTGIFIFLLQEGERVFVLGPFLLGLGLAGGGSRAFWARGH